MLFRSDHDLHSFPTRRSSDLLEVDLFDSWNGKIEEYEILHVFGSVKDCLGLIEVAKARNVKVVITPLLWSDVRRAIFTDGSFRTKVEFLGRHLAKVICPSFPSARRRLLTCADLIFPNSVIEREQIARLFAVSRQKMRVVVNGVDQEFTQADPSLFMEAHGKDPFILGVGRIEPRKNQLNLIRALKRIGNIRLVLIGSPVSGYESYFSKCQEEGRDFTLFLPTIKHGDPLLKSAYAACELFVLQGWFETPGLVAMEAALAGAKVIATMGGSTREYFQDHVDYIDPSSPLDIGAKIVKNLEKPKSDAFKKHILSSFTWDKVARSTVDFYREVLRWS